MDFSDLLNRRLDHVKVYCPAKHILVLIRQIYNKMIKWGLWDGQNPIKGVKLPKINNRRVRFLTHQEAEELLGAVRKRSQQFWEYSLLPGHLRLGQRPWTKSAQALRLPIPKQALQAYPLRSVHNRAVGAFWQGICFAGLRSIPRLNYVKI
jgi:hypothetical protein